MDRDIALQVVSKLELINTELEILSDCATPSVVPEDLGKSVRDPEDAERMKEEPAEEPAEEPEPEPEPETKSTRSSK